MGDETLTLRSDDFAFFGVPARFAQDRMALDQRWKELQRQAHPDKFAAQDPAAQRLAMQWSVRINEAYQRLKDPLKRAAYLCERAGVPVNAENNTAMPAEFLLQQMEWRESLDEATGPAQIEVLEAQVTASRQAILQRCEELLDRQQDYVQAVAQVRALMFIERFARDVETRADQFAASAAGRAT